MSTFKDSFTRDEGNDNLGYDDVAFYYFASSVLLVIAIPWTYKVAMQIIFPGHSQIEKEMPTKTKAGLTYRYCKSAGMVKRADEARAAARRSVSITTLGVKIGILALMWLTLANMYVTMGDAKEIKTFDPYEILDVGLDADDAQIKKAYRKLSLIWHPDKNPDDPEAAAKFIVITKAHSALTDPVAKENFAKYGNPDGPGQNKFGIGLPSFMIKKDNQLIILAVFFSFLLFVIPTIFICYYNSTKIYAPNGLMVETLQFLGQLVTDGTRAKNCPELIAASAESRSMTCRAEDDKAMAPIMREVVEVKKRQWNVPIIVRNNFLIQAHMQRLHHLMSPELREDLDSLLKSSMKITQAMIEIACVREWFFTVQAMIEFRRYLIQAMDIKSSHLLQVPHLTEEHIRKHCERGKNKVTSLSDFLTQPAEERKGMADMSPDQMLDIEAFAAHASHIDIIGKVEVEDEDEIAVGDIATATIKIKRKNLTEDEAMGPVHAPFFPEPKFEEWWIFLIEPTSTRIICFEKLKDTAAVAEVKMKFQVSRPGVQNLTVHAMCDSYAGLDQKVELKFDAKTQDEANREHFVHPEDEELDRMPTLFQQMMGEVPHDDTDDELEDMTDNEKAERAQAMMNRIKAKQEAEGKVTPGAKKKADDDDSSSSDSDSD